ncbi:NAD(P)H-dependent oxidoreductase subunit E [Granulicella sibirica]|uniref:NAD-reducing hydrogenase subunit HoxF n=1 Tax=Granulicella sibirica TaxID=2479048 RepID=A0A4Q0T334_9BACT|nr:NAD(P)H-dependent oxidoreductase subunit E [Granulicella sibirica]RXH55951.1 NAD-reducing hydrogenase subunit HoxF [Granulicella sibirica]
MALPEVLVNIEPGRNKLGVFEDLRHVQDSIGYVPMREIEKIATRRAVAVKDVHTVASFYPHFRLKPPIRVDVRVCDDMTCHLLGARKLREQLSRQYASASEQVQVRDISCVGRCDHGPIVSINEHYHEHTNFRQVVSEVDRELVSPRGEEHSHAPRSPEERGMTIQCDPYATEAEHYGIFRRVIAQKNYDEVLALLKGGDLRGMGGAGFPTFIKWEGARKSPGIEKFVVCNADESEPGTIKDRFILQYLPHMVFEGMMIAGAIVGAQYGYLYIRHEYELQTEVLNEELNRIRALGLLGNNIMGTGIDFDMEVFVSPGGYICGEETALMEAIQGNRSEPRNKPPRTVNSGVWNKPTALNNVETFCHAITILGKGGQWYHDIGQNGSAGIKFVGVTGNVKHPGVFEVPMGISYRELIYGYAGGPLEGREIIGFAPSGPSSGYLPASQLDLALDWDKVKAVGSMLGSGAVVVCDDTSCMLDMALVASRFYRNESCGKCSPCRIGTQKLVDLIENWTQGVNHGGDEKLLKDLSNVLRTASLCGLGQISPAPIQSVQKHFPELMRQHIEDHVCTAGICFSGSTL